MSEQEIAKPKRKKPVSTKGMSAKYFRERGCQVADVERHLPIPGKFVTVDAFGFGDLLVIIGARIALVQATTMANLAAREAKIRAIPEHRAWLYAQGRILVHGWALRGKRGERKTWTLTEREILAESPQER
jgi:hypothetical protein